MNLGRNPLSHLPPNFGLIKSLKAVWLDDCEIEGPIPECLFQLDKLQVLRISNNRITELNGNGEVATWKDLEVLCLDGNLIEHVPEEVMALTKLKMLLLR